MSKAKITYLGHSGFFIQSPGGKRLAIDPWLTGNPLCPTNLNSAEKLGGVDVLMVTHGHFDHANDVIAISQRYQPQVLANYEIATFLESKGLKNIQAMNKGGGLKVPGCEPLHVRMTHAIHSSMIQDGNQWVYGGEAASFLITLEDGFRIYHAGDTMLFTDMKLIGELYKPDLAMVPIGDRFTMDPEQAALACQYLKVKKAIPMHHSTFPLLTGTPEQFAKFLAGTGIEMIALKPGESC